MNKIIRSITGILLAAVLCIGLCSAAFAEESGEADAEISIDDLLSLLTALTGDSGGEGAAANEFCEYTYENVTIAFPASWMIDESDEGGLSGTSNDLTRMVSFMVMDSEGEEIDLTDQDDVDMLIESLGGEEVLDQIEYFELCGSLGLWIRETFSEEGLTISTYCVVAQVDTSVLYLTLAVFGEADESIDELFATIVDSIRVEGAAGNTDFSNIYTGSLIDYTLVEPAEISSSGQYNGVDANDKKDAPPQVLDAAFEDELVLIDDDVCTVKITEFITDNDYYPLELKMYAENKTDLNLTFSMDDVAINGYVISTWWYEDVASGHKSNSDVTFYNSDFELNGIEQIRDISFTVTVSDSDDWSADDLEDQDFTIYPFGQDVPEQAPQEFDDDDLVIVDNDDVKMIITGFESDDYYFRATVYIENNTDLNMSFSVSDSTAVNGYEINPYFSRTLSPGRKMNSYITWFNSDLEENGIEEIDDLELDVTISYYDDWYADPVYKDTVFISFD